MIVFLFTVTNSGTLNEYLEVLLRFLIQNVGRYPFLEGLARDVIRQIRPVLQRSDGKVLESPTVESEVTYSRAVLDLRNVLSVQTSSQITPSCFSTIHEISGGKRLNAALATVLVELISVQPDNGALQSAKKSWSPIEQESPSSFERIAMAHLFSSVPSSVALGEDVCTRTLQGFVFSRRKLYILARDILQQVVASVERVHGGSSREYVIVVAELVKCCTMTQDLASGRRWAEHALSILQPGKDGYDPALFVRIALADSWLANAQYEDAVGLIQNILKAERRDPSMTLKLLLRLSKALRRLGNIFPSAQIVEALVQGIQVLDEAPNELQLAFLEEVLCNLNRVDIADPLIGKTASAACEAAANIKSIITMHTGDNRHIPYKDSLEEWLRVIELMCSRRDLSSMCFECSTAPACYLN